MKLTHIDGVPITKPCTDHDRGYIKGWEASGVRKAAQNVVNELLYLTQKGRSSIPEWVTSRVTHCVKELESALTGKD